MMRWVKNTCLALLCLALGAVITEGFLRILIPPEAHFETWFTPGIESWDPEFGAVYNPNWSGSMRHMDGIYRGVPLQLDEHGFRLPAKNDLSGEPKRVLLIGGRSAMMSYGLSDAEAIPRQTAEAANLPVEIQSISWAGGNILRNWNLYRRHLLDEPYDLVIISHLNPYLPSFKDPSTFDSLPQAAPEEWVFRYMEGIQLWRDGLFQEVGPNAFKSYLGYGLIRLADYAQKNLSLSGKKYLPTLADAVAAQAVAPDTDDLEGYIAFLRHMEAHFENKGAKVLLHLPPRPFGELDHHAPYRESFSTHFDVIDLHRRLHPQMKNDMFIADGHYDRELAKMIGDELALEISKRLSPTHEAKSSTAN